MILGAICLENTLFAVLILSLTACGIFVFIGVRMLLKTIEKNNEEIDFLNKEIKKPLFVSCLLYSERYKGYLAKVEIDKRTGAIKAPDAVEDRVLVKSRSNSTGLLVLNTLGEPNWSDYGGIGHNGETYIKMLGAIYTCPNK